MYCEFRSFRKTPHPPRILIRRILHKKNGEKGLKNAFLGINSKSSPRGGGPLPPSGVLAQTYSSGKKCISKEISSGNNCFFGHLH